MYSASKKTMTNIFYPVSNFSHQKQSDPAVFVRLKLSLDTVYYPSFTRELGRSDIVNWTFVKNLF